MFLIGSMTTKVKLIITGLLFFSSLVLDAKGSDNLLTLNIGYSSQVDTTRVWPHMQNFYLTSLPYMHALTDSQLRSLGRFRLSSEIVSLDSEAVTKFSPKIKAEYVAHFIVRSLNRIYRNRTIYLRNPGYASLTQQQEEAIPRQIKSLPAITISLEVRLINKTSRKTLWSQQRDSTLLIPHRERFVLNPEKYPGYTDPKFIRDYTAPILRQRFRNPGSLRTLTVADRWYLSSPQDDIAYARNLTEAVVVKSVMDLMAQLPIRGQILSIQEPDQQSGRQFTVDLGEVHGIRDGLTLDVYSEKRKLEKIGKIKIVATGRNSSVAREHKIERGARKNGIFPSVGDPVVSEKRP